MGGGNSKETIKTEKIKNDASSKPGNEPDAFANYKGPTAKPVLEQSASPVKSAASSKPLLAQADDHEPDD